MSYFVSFNYLDQPGLILNQYYKRGSLRSNLDFKINDKLDLKFYMLTAIPSSRNTAYVGDTGDPFASAAFWDPTKPVVDPTTGKLTLTSQYGTLNVSPVAQATISESGCKLGRCCWYRCLDISYFEKPHVYFFQFL